MQLQHLSKRFMALLMSFGLLLSTVAALPATAHAASASSSVKAPGSTVSYYESNLSAATFKTQGCNAAKGPGGLVVLDFGEPQLSGSTYGTHLFGSGGFVSNSAISSAAKTFINAVWSCRKSSTSVHVVIGTNNYMTGLGTTSTARWNTAGKLWGTLSNGLMSYVYSKKYGSKVLVSGGDDIETEWANYSLSSSFVKGFNSTSYLIFFDYGDDTPGYWTQAQVWYVATGAPDDEALPQIYYAGDATQDWEPLSYWACQHGKEPVLFAGVMAEYPYQASNTPNQAWTDMYNAEGKYKCTASVRSRLVYSTNI